MIPRSADLMQRNLDRRVEQLFPLREQRHRDKVRRLLELQLADTANAWELQPDGSFERLGPKRTKSPSTARRSCSSRASGLLASISKST